jgi:hypothetical protein
MERSRGRARDVKAREGLYAEDVCVWEPQAPGERLTCHGYVRITRPR